MVRQARRASLTALVASLIGAAQPGGWALAGRTIDADGIPVPSANVTLVNTLDRRRRVAKTGPKGSFQFRGLTSGATYDLQARLGDAVSQTQRVARLGAQRVVLVELRIPMRRR